MDGEGEIIPISYDDTHGLMDSGIKPPTNTTTNPTQPFCSRINNNKREEVILYIYIYYYILLK